jgi:hypothetical protein
MRQTDLVVSPFTLCTAIARLIVCLAAAVALRCGWSARGHRKGTGRTMGLRMVVSPQDFAVRIQSDRYETREKVWQYCSVRTTLAKRKGA